MIAFILSWIVIFSVLFSFGDMVIVLYNKICRQDEKYNYFDTLLLGMSFLIIPLSFWSFWLPSNQYFLALSLVVSLCYWIVFRQRFRQLFDRIRAGINGLRKWQVALIVFFIAMCLTAWIWEGFAYDSMYYHQQAIRWNEEYKIIPGLGNLGDRLAFNSNYILLSSIFTFRFLFGAPVYSFQGLFPACLICWAFIELFRSGYNIKRLIFFLLFIIYYIISVYSLQNTSTDILPNLIVFYLVAKCLYAPDSFNKNYLLAVVFIFIMTLKLSFAPFLLLPLYLFYRLLKEKKYNVILFCSIFSIAIVALWIARNIILSGYIAYPIYQIDLFPFDWKIPEEIAVAQDNYVKIMGRDSVRNLLYGVPEFYRDPLPLLYLTKFMYLLTFISYILLISKALKDKRSWSGIFNPIFIAITLTLLMWVIKGPDARFVNGVICAIIVYNLSTFFAVDKKFPRLGISLISLTTLAFIIWSVVFFAQHYREAVTESKGKIKYELGEVFYKPHPYRYSLNAREIEEATGQRYYLGDSILIHIHSHSLVLDDIPSAMDFDYNKGRFIDYTKIENRGHTIEDGFRLRN